MLRDGVGDEGVEEARWRRRVMTLLMRRMESDCEMLDMCLKSKGMSCDLDVYVLPARKNLLGRYRSLQVFLVVKTLESSSVELIWLILQLC